MEVMKQWVEPAEAVVEEVVEILHGRQRRQHPHIDMSAATSNNSTTSSDGSMSSTPTNGSGSSGGDNQEGLDKSLGFENGKGKTEERYSYERVEDLDSKLKNSNNQKSISEIVDGEEDEKSQTHSIMPLKKRGKEEEDDDLKSKLKLIKEMLAEDEEIVELEFERAVKHIDTHTTLYCPNCSSCITKVFIRKKKVVQPKTPEILGCFSCFSLFIPSGDGFSLWPFGNGGKIKTTQTLHQQITQTSAGENITPKFSNGKVNMVTEEGNCFSMFGIFADKKRTKAQIDNKEKQKKESVEGEPDQTHPQQVIYKPHQAEDQHESPVDVRIDIINNKGKIKPTTEPSSDPVDEIPKPDNFGSMIDTSFNPTEAQNIGGGHPSDVGQETSLATPLIPPRVPHLKIIRDSKSVEILKSIVYGGLMELIASLSIVSSSVASGATTLNIITIGLANLVGGLIIIFHNLRDLKNDCSRIVSKRTNQEVERYQEVLGRRENFLLHATIVVLSFLLFGLIPPITYGFSFRTNDNTDLKLAAVAAASLLCIILLAIGKAYIYNPPKFYAYFKTTMYYIVTTISVSGVSYVVGDLINILVGKIGWFETSAGVALPLSEMKSINQAWASF